MPEQIHKATRACE